jgi:hypothetical protein
MTFTIRREAGFFDSNHGEPREVGDLYRGSLEGSGIMLRILLEFLGVKANPKKPAKLVSSDKRDAVLGQGRLASIAAVDIGKLDSPPTEQFLARMHD